MFLLATETNMTLTSLVGLGFFSLLLVLDLLPEGDHLVVLVEPFDSSRQSPARTQVNLPQVRAILKDLTNRLHSTRTATQIENPEKNRNI